MKKITYEDWQKNPTPRMMWVWDDSEEDKQQRKVIYFLGSKAPFPVVVLTADESACDIYMHCAEIEKQKQKQRQRRMTNKELSRWLRKNPTREFRREDYSTIGAGYTYTGKNSDEEVSDTILIRENDGEWREPLVEE